MQPHILRRELQFELEALRGRLLAIGIDVPDDAAARAANESARFQLVCLLDWHRRVDKAAW